MINEVQDIHTLISGCKAGHRKAQEQLYRSYYRVMMNLCLRYTKNERDALEVLNTGFYKVYKNIHRYHPGQASLYTWIRAIIINSCLDFIKTKGTKEESGELEQAANVHVPPAVIAKMSASDILELVRQLPPATQAVFNLYVMEGYKHHEIAAMTGTSEGTSKWHLSEARKKLQQMIKEQTVP
ncbi:MAG: sigma-70 family RNA polymerase sigma factor [Ferruginibacter sp.]|nr:sigma-70 family RNA polymerase sigma factor [Chitinophagaceae bacterium]